MKSDRENNKSQGESRPVGNLESTQTRNGQRTIGGVGEGIESGRPDSSGNRSGGEGSVSQQSGKKRNDAPASYGEMDGGAPSGQTSGAKDESGQL